MIKAINGFFSILKILLLLASFVFSFFIIINMYKRLDKNYVDSIVNFIPYVLLFVLFSINIIFRQKSVNGCMFYNITCCLVFSVILFAAFRTFNDNNMVIILRLGYNINFNYFADIIAPMRAMLYLLSASNILLMIDGRLKKKILEKKNKEVTVI